jgi:hypothetical protein
MIGRILAGGFLAIQRRSVVKTVVCPEINSEVIEEKGKKKYSYSNCGDFCSKFKEPFKIFGFTVIRTCSRTLIFKNFTDERK